MELSEKLFLISTSTLSSASVELTEKRMTIVEAVMKIENVGERGTTGMKAREFQTNKQIFAYGWRHHVNPE